MILTGSGWEYMNKKNRFKLLAHHKKQNLQVLPFLDFSCAGRGLVQRCLCRHNHRLNVHGANNPVLTKLGDG